MNEHDAKSISDFLPFLCVRIGVHWAYFQYIIESLPVLMAYRHNSFIIEIIQCYIIDIYLTFSLFLSLMRTGFSLCLLDFCLHVCCSRSIWRIKCNNINDFWRYFFVVPQKYGRMQKRSLLFGYFGFALLLVLSVLIVVCVCVFAMRIWRCVKIQPFLSQPEPAKYMLCVV